MTPIDDLAARLRMLAVHHAGDDGEATANEAADALLRQASDLEAIRKHMTVTREVDGRVVIDFDAVAMQEENARLKSERDAAVGFNLMAQAREAEEARFYRYLRDEAGEHPDDDDGPMICAGLDDQFDYLRGEECDIAIRAAIEAYKP